MHSLRFRQIHLDFHTSPHIPNIAAEFDKAAWQQTLKDAHVNSITTFATCHHGWRYYDGQVGAMHPHLGFDLLRAQFEASKEIDVNVPIYLTAGVNDYAFSQHPEWREINAEGGYAAWSTSPLQPGFKKLCFNTPYLDYLCEQIEEVVTRFPENDGIFLDIISQGACCCSVCMQTMVEQGYDPAREEDRKTHAEKVLLNYYTRTTAAARCKNVDTPVFHNSGHITIGRRDLLEHFSHLELESLPTGGWGYDHFPMSAKYVQTLGYDFLGMTGKFHTTWGEFGGFKHPNALRYECAAMIAFNAKCSIGDQLHPGAALDRSTYNLIGQAYSEVAEKEPWCVGAQSSADIGLLSQVPFASDHGRGAAGDVGAGRILLESHLQFDVLDQHASFDGYALLIIPDSIRFDEALAARVQAYLDGGGRVLLSGESGLRQNGQGFALDLGCTHEGESPFCPDYWLPIPELRPEFLETPFVSYIRSQRIRVAEGESLGQVYDPYFNRTYAHYSSHQHTPFRPDPSGYDLGVLHGRVLYFSAPVFSLYRGFGATLTKDVVQRGIRKLMGDALNVRSNLPSTARVSLNHQPDENRYVLHLLYANTLSRGGKMDLAGGTVSRDGLNIEIIEELLPLRDSQLSVALPATIQRVTLEPQGEALPFTVADGRVEFTVPEFTCHQMVCLQDTK